jgi:hypothetical protein
VWSFALKRVVANADHSETRQNPPASFFLVLPSLDLQVNIDNMSTAWDNARRHARALETAVDSKLSSYSRLAATISRASSSTSSGSSSRDVQAEEEGIGGYKLVEEEIGELLGKVSSRRDKI